MNNIVATPIRFVRRNKTRILLATTVILTGVVVVQHKGIKQHNEFLTENGMYDAFYAQID